MRQCMRRIGVSARVWPALLAVIVLALAFGGPANRAAATVFDNGQFYYPSGIATDAPGNVYVADWGNERIQKLTSNGAFITKWGSYGSGDGQFYYSNGIATDAAGNVYVADTLNHRIQKFTSNGTFITKWGSEGSGDGQFFSPRGIATDAAGNVFVADTGNERIQKLTSNGAFITKWGSYGSGDGQFYYSNGIATDAAGNVYVADTLNHRIQKFTSNGTFITKWGSEGSGDGQFFSPRGIATDAAGNVYVADTGNNRIQKLTSNGTFITKWGSCCYGDGRFSDPTYIATDAAGNVYVADTGNNRIQKFSSDGVSLAKWGGSPPPRVLPQTPEVSRPTIAAGPNAKTTRRSATFRFTSRQSEVRFQCMLSGRRVAKAFRHWRACTSPKRYASLRPGRKVFWVRAVKGGSTSKAATRSWTIVKRRGPRSHPDRRRKLLVIPANRRKAFFKPECRFVKCCRACVTTKAGNRILARGRYSIPAHSLRKVAIALTGAGQKALARKRRIRAKLITVTPTPKHVTVPIIWRRR